MANIFTILIYNSKGDKYLPTSLLLLLGCYNFFFIQRAFASFGRENCGFFCAASALG